MTTTTADDERLEVDQILASLAAQLAAAESDFPPDGATIARLRVERDLTEHHRDRLDKAAHRRSEAERAAREDHTIDASHEEPDAAYRVMMADLDALNAAAAQLCRSVDAHQRAVREATTAVRGVSRENSRVRHTTHGITVDGRPLQTVSHLVAGEVARAVASLLPLVDSAAAHTLHGRASLMSKLPRPTTKDGHR